MFLNSWSLKENMMSWRKKYLISTQVRATQQENQIGINILPQWQKMTKKKSGRWFQLMNAKNLRVRECQRLCLGDRRRWRHWAGILSATDARTQGPSAQHETLGRLSSPPKGASRNLASCSKNRKWRTRPSQMLTSPPDIRVWRGSGGRRHHWTETSGTPRRRVTEVPGEKSRGNEIGFP